MIGPLTLEWDMSSNCEKPYFRRDLFTASNKEKVWFWDTFCRKKNSIADVEYYPDLAWRWVHSYRNFYIIYWTPCRKCPKCLAKRASRWRLAASHEIANAERTWFGTLTLNPSSLHSLEAETRVRLRRAAVNPDKLPGDEIWRELVRTIGKELTKFLKRVRKNSQARLRYVAVYERHKSGVPHIHLLIHEYETPVPYRVLQAAWKLGFTHFKLVDSRKAATYVSKYLSKSLCARVRASQGYGKYESILPPSQ